MSVFIIHQERQEVRPNNFASEYNRFDAKRRCVVELRQKQLVWVCGTDGKLKLTLSITAPLVGYMWVAILHGLHISENSQTGSFGM
jgi:hypothetical protein